MNPAGNESPDKPNELNPAPDEASPYGFGVQGVTECPSDEWKLIQGSCFLSSTTKMNWAESKEVVFFRKKGSSIYDVTLGLQNRAVSPLYTTLPLITLHPFLA